MDVGIRELRADLSRWVRRAQAGEEVVVTDRGKAVARLVPLGNVERRIDSLIKRGLVTPAPQPWHGALPKPIKGAGPLSDVVLDGRR